MEYNIVVKTPEDLGSAAGELLERYPQSRLFAFYGEMGAGKTTFIKALCKLLKVTDNVSSPTFSVINEYHTLANGNVYHFDFYRLKSEEEAYDLGYEEYFYSNQYCFMEWPEKVQHLIPELCVKVQIRVQGNSRVISISR